MRYKRFKSNSAILNSLLKIINERIFYNNGTPTKVPLMTLVGASNEYPEPDDGLDALFDRFLLRYEIDYLKDNNNFVAMLKGAGTEKDLPKITLQELEELQFYASMVTVPDQIYNVLSQIRTELQDEGINPSDRRFKQSLSLVKGKALLSQRQEVEETDLGILSNCLWEEVDQKQLVKKIVESYSKDVLTKKLEDIQQNMDDIIGNVDVDSTDSVVEASSKLKYLDDELVELMKKYPQKMDVIEKKLQELRKEKQKMSEAILGAI